MTIALPDNLVREGTARRQRAAAFVRRVARPALVVGLATGVLLALLAAGRWVADATRIEVVRVEGSFGAHTQGEIEHSLASLVAGHSLLDVPMREIASELGALSWVSAVDVYRVWPHGLIVRVTEKVPVAHWNGDGFISHAGEVFQPENAGKVGALPSLAGPEDKAVQVMKFYSDVNSMMLPLGLAVQQLTLNEQLSWEIVTGDGIRLRVDQDDGLSRLRRFLRVYEKRLRDVSNRIDSVDLRYIGGFAVHWAPPVATPALPGPASNESEQGAAAPGGEHGTHQQQ